MSFSLLGPFSYGAKVTSAVFNQLDTDHSNSLDKSVAGDAIEGTITFTGAGNITANTAASIKTTAVGAIELGGGASDWPTFSTTRARQIVSGAFPLALVGAWTSGLGYVIGGATIDDIAIPLRVHDNSVVTSVSLYFTIENPHASLPDQQPGFAVIRRLMADGSIGGFLSTGTTRLAAATTGGYYSGGAVQSLTFVPDQNNGIDVSQYSYYAVLVDESGANSIPGNQYLGLSMTFSGIATMAFQ